MGCDGEGPVSALVPSRNSVAAARPTANADASVRCRLVSCRRMFALPHSVPRVSDAASAGVAIGQGRIESALHACVTGKRRYTRAAVVLCYQLRLQCIARTTRRASSAARKTEGLVCRRGEPAGGEHQRDHEYERRGEERRARHDHGRGRRHEVTEEPGPDRWPGDRRQVRHARERAL